MKKNVLIIVVLLTVIFVYSGLSVSRHQNERFTADSMIYISLAQKYLSGDFQNAINGYWGPLLAWILVPLIYLGFSPVVAINLLDLFTGILTIAGVLLLSYRFDLTDWIRIIILISLLPVVLMFSLVQPMDFILLCILVYYLYVVFDSEYCRRTFSGVTSGVLGSLAYFTKSYAFPFFIVHFLVMNILHYFRSLPGVDRRKTVRNLIAGFLVFFLISGTWITVISDKYGYSTFSTMRKTNFNAPGPEATYSGLEFNVPVFYKGFYEPSNDTAFVVWEDPSYLEGNKWSPLDSWIHFRHFIKLVLKNMSEGLRILNSYSSLSITILLSYILLILLEPGRKLLFRGDLIYPLFTVVLFSGGYLLFHVEPRYLWLTNVLLLLMGGYVLHVLLQKDLLRGTPGKVILIAVFIASFIFVPSRYVIQAGNDNIERNMYEVSADLKKDNVKGNLASNREFVPTHEAWHKTFRLAYWLDGRYYGQRGEGVTDSDLEDELRKYDIDYYFFWGDTNSIPQLFSRYREVTDDQIPGLRVYSLKEEK